MATFGDANQAASGQLPIIPDECPRSGSPGALHDLVRFIGPNAASYIARPTTRGALPWSWLARWHWPACLVTVPWLFYRKMYAGGLILVALPVVLGLIVPGGLFFGWTLVIGLVAGLFGRQWYLDHAARRIADTRRNFRAGAYRNAFLRHAGGVSIPGAILGCAIEVASAMATLSGLLQGNM